MTDMRRLTATILLLATVAWSATAAAQTADEKARAKKHFDDGSKLYADEQYNAALVEFQEGNGLFPHPMFRYNIALCHWRLNELDDAIDQAGLAHEDLVKIGDPDATTLNLSRLTAFRRIKSAVQTADETRAQALLLAEDVVVEDSDGGSGGGWALTGIGGGLTLVGVGLLAGWGVFEISLGETIADYEAAAADGNEAEWTRLRSLLESRQATSKVLLFSGAATTAVGGALLLWGILSSSDSEVAIIPTTSGVQAFVRF